MNKANLKSLFAISIIQPAIVLVLILSLFNPACSVFAESHDMVSIPGGEFQMGDSKNESWISERPVHAVTLDSFYIGKYEVTNQQYCAFLNWADDNGWITVTNGVVYKAGSGTSYPYCDTFSADYYSQISYSGDVFSVRTKGVRNMANDPMVMVSWYGAAAYCNWRSQQEGKEQCYNLSTWACDFSKKGYRLATEAEWEYAARGGLVGRRFPWGDTISHSQANYLSDSSYSYDISPTRGHHPTWIDGIYPYTAPVGSFQANGYGLYEMAGNVWEWCNDWYSSTYYSTTPYPHVNPTGPISDTYRVMRGGGWVYFAEYCRVAFRFGHEPRYRAFSLGFRLVLGYGKEFMITFDDGPVPGNTKNIVDALKNIKVANGEPVKAGFFMVGVGCCENSTCFCPWYDRWPPKGSVRENPALVQMAAKAGHYIGDHTQHHPDFNAWFKDWSVESIKLEISNCYNEIKTALGLGPNEDLPKKIFRPPYFSLNANVCTAANKLDFQIILGAGENRNQALDIGWPSLPSADEIKEKARTLIESWERDEPCVLVFHDISPITANNIAEIIRYLREDEGFTLVHFDPDRLPGGRSWLLGIMKSFIRQGENKRDSISLDSTVTNATFSLSWQGSDIDLVLYKPDGTKIDPNSTLVDPNIKYAERDTYEYYFISDPNPGSWIMEVSGVNVPPEGEKYTIRVESDTNLALFAFTDKPAYGLNEQIYITAELVNDENSVTGALVTAKVQRPVGSIDNLTLYDDGTHGDEEPNDGFYANAYKNTSLRGSYEITVSSIGELTGDQYERAFSLTVMVGSIFYGNIDFSAYAVFADHWMTHNCTGPAWCDTADIDQSGKVDIFDLGILVEYWLEDTSP